MSNQEKNIINRIYDQIKICCASSLISENYNLIKEFKDTQLIQIKESPEIIKEDYNGKKIDDFEEKFKRSLKKFLYIVSQNTSVDNLQLLLNNINSLTISIKNIKKTRNNIMVNGYYYMFLNKIIISKNTQEETIMHELFHASSTIVNKNEKIIFSGFRQVSADKDIGIGLNEGYTQYLTEKKFLISNSPCYLCEKMMAKGIELIVGKDKMESFYFHANLKKLVEELKKYRFEEEIHKFIVNLDLISKHFYDRHLLKYSNKILIESIKFNITFLLKCYFVKLIIESKEQNIDIKKIINNDLKPMLDLIDKFNSLCNNIVNEKEITNYLVSNIFTSSESVELNHSKVKKLTKKLS